MFYIEHADYRQKINETCWHVLSMIIDNQNPPVHLSPRQKACLSLVAEGNTAGQIALKLGISIRMVRFHLRAAREKLGAVSTAQAIHRAAKADILNSKG